MLALVAAAAGAAPATAECDDACKQRIADRRKLFEQSRTTNDRQVIFDLSATGQAVQHDVSGRQLHSGFAVHLRFERMLLSETVRHVVVGVQCSIRE